MISYHFLFGVTKIQRYLNQNFPNEKIHFICFKFDGEGHWHLDTLDSGTLMTLNEEKLQLEAKLAGVSKLEDRLKEVYQLLGEDVSQHPIDNEVPSD
jgi:hypothetical protein